MNTLNNNGISNHNNLWPNDVGYFENQQPIFGHLNNNNSMMTPIIGATSITGSQNPSSMETLNRHSVTDINSGVGIMNGVVGGVLPLLSNHTSRDIVGSLNGLMNGMHINSVKLSTTSTQTKEVTFFIEY